VQVKYLIVFISISLILLLSGCTLSESVYNNSRIVDTNGDAKGVDTVDGMLRVSSQDYLYSISEGLVPEHSSFAKLGFNDNVGEEDVWTIGGLYVFPTVAQQMELVSTSVEDDPVKADTNPGTGVWTVRISYLDSSYAEHTEVVELNGLGVVTTVATDIFRVNALRAESCGSDYKAAGTINIRNLADTPVYRSIATGFTCGRSAVFTVPAGKTLYITSVAISSGYSTAGKNVRWIGRANYDDVSNTILTAGLFFMPYFEMQTQDSEVVRPMEMPLRIPATVDFKMSAISDSANSVCDMSVRGWIESN
jgi:hypothetical protein